MGDALSVVPLEPSRYDVDAIEESLTDALEAEGETQVKEFEKTTEGFRGEKPDFEVLTEIEGDDLVLLVSPSGSEEAVNKWRWLDEGTRPHLIRPRRADYLRFRPNYRAGSQPGVLKTRRAQASGDFVYARAVRHPGTEARGWSEMIQEKRKLKFVWRMYEALREAL